jgi:nucleotide-binding universal stress UspA family protein
MAGLTALIPLDGTDLSESSYELLPLLKTLGFDRVRLVGVWEHVWSDDEVHGREDAELAESTERGRAYVRAYLDEQASKVKERGFEVETEVRIGRAAEEMLEHADETGADLILIATHGRSGIARWRLGSVADKVIRSAGCPTLVIGPNVEVELAPYRLERVLVPLDGSALSEEALTVAAMIAAKTGAALDLARVVSLTPLAFDDSTGVYPIDLLGAMEQASQTYLNRMAASVSGVQAQTTLLIGSAADQLIEHARKSGAGLVVMASHGRGGFVRAALGSVTDRLLHGPAPVLVLRPEEHSPSRLAAAARTS